MELFVFDEIKWFLIVLDYYEFVEVKYNVVIMDDNYVGFVDEGFRLLMDGYGSVRFEYLEIVSVLVNYFCVDVDNGSELEEF